MNRINLILLLLLLNPTLILMLKKRNGLLKRNEYLVDTCCSFKQNDQILISCSQNQFIQLKLVEIYYNQNEYCSSEYSCCKYQTKCSRRITKYSNLHCDGKNSCWIDKTCLKIYDECSHIDGLYGQYITIQYSCLSNYHHFNILFNNQTDSHEEEESIPFIVKLSTFDQNKANSLINQNSVNNFFGKTDFKSSPVFLIIVIFVFLIFLCLIYWLADFIGKKLCRQTYPKNKMKRERISTEILLQHPIEIKSKVQSNPPLTTTRIYPSHSNNLYSHERYLSVHHHPFTGQIYSRTFHPYFNY